MSTTVKYKDSTLTTITNETKTIKTANKWVEDNFVFISSSGDGMAVYQDENGYLVLDDDGDNIVTSHLNISVNGTYTATTGTAYDSVTVDVPINNYLKSFVDRSVTTATTVDLPNVTVIGDDAFNRCTMLTTVNLPNVTTLNPRGFYGCSSLSSVNLPNVVTVRDNQFDGCTSLINLSLPKCTTLGGASALRNITNLKMIYVPLLRSINQTFGMAGNTKLTVVALPLASGTIGSYFFSGCSLLKTVDLGSGCKSIQATVFQNTVLDTLILRSTSVVTLQNMNAFDNSPFRTSGANVSIYIPETLYNALDSGTNDYKATTNWSTLPSYGANITWAKIEGSYYETHYADGTSVGS